MYTHQYRDLCHEENRLHIIETDNLGTFYKHVNKRIRHRDTVPALIDNNGLTVTAEEEKANILNKYFAYVGIVDNGRVPYSIQIQPSNVFDTVVFDEQNIMQAIRKLKINLSAGPEGLPPLLFKYLQLSIVKPLALLFTQLFSVGAIPGV